jgi:hypothetical protein
MNGVLVGGGVWRIEKEMMLLSFKFIIPFRLTTPFHYLREYISSNRKIF